MYVDDVVIRSATDADVERIGQLWEELVEFHWILDKELPRSSSDGAKLYARRISDRIDDDHTRILVAEIDEVIIGFTLGVIVDLVAEMFMPDIGGFLADIYVQDGHRKRGVGRKLVESLAQWFRESGVTFIELSVAHRNTEARAFWNALGGRDLMVRMRLPLKFEQ